MERSVRGKQTLADLKIGHYKSCARQPKSPEGKKFGLDVPRGRGAFLTENSIADSKLMVKRYFGY